MTPVCTTVQLSDVYLETGWSLFGPDGNIREVLDRNPLTLTFISSKIAIGFDFSFHFGLILAVTVQQNRFLEESYSFYNTLIKVQQ